MSDDLYYPNYSKDETEPSTSKFHNENEEEDSSDDLYISYDLSSSDDSEPQGFVRNSSERTTLPKTKKRIIIGQATDTSLVRRWIEEKEEKWKKIVR